MDAVSRLSIDSLISISASAWYRFIDIFLEIDDPLDILSIGVKDPFGTRSDKTEVFFFCSAGSDGVCTAMSLFLLEFDIGVGFGTGVKVVGFPPVNHVSSVWHSTVLLETLATAA